MIVGRVVGLGASRYGTWQAAMEVETRSRRIYLLSCATNLNRQFGDIGRIKFHVYSILGFRIELIILRDE